MKARNCLAALSCFAMVVAATPADAGKPKVEKSEVDKAVRKCIGSVIVGSILGAVIAGKHDRGKGLIIGAAAGGVVCTILMASAKRKDRLTAAQRSAATSGRRFTTSYADEDGRTHQLTAMPQIYTPNPSSQLRQVRYTDESGASQVSPLLTSPPKLCRRVPVTDSIGNESALIPPQLYCLNPDSNRMEPYSEHTT